MTSLPAFAPLELDVNPSEWGPTVLPAHLQDVSYAPFSKGARLGALANFLEAPRPGGASSRGGFMTVWCGGVGRGGRLRYRGWPWVLTSTVTMFERGWEERAQRDGGGGGFGVLV
jgi:hypothetical protein